MNTSNNGISVRKNPVSLTEIIIIGVNRYVDKVPLGHGLL